MSNSCRNIKPPPLYPLNMTSVTEPCHSDNPGLTLGICAVLELTVTPSCTLCHFKGLAATRITCWKIRHHWHETLSHICTYTEN